MEVAATSHTLDGYLYVLELSVCAGVIEFCLRFLVWFVLLIDLVFGVFVIYLSSSCALCVLLCKCLCVVYSWLHLRFSLTFCSIFSFLCGVL